jgi:MFS family permease
MHVAVVVPIYAVAFCSVLVAGYFNDKYPQYRGVMIATSLAFASISSIVVCAVYNATARYVLLVFMATGLLTANASSLAFSSSTLGAMRQEARAVSLAFINAMAGFSGIYGAYLFPSEDGPKYIMGFAVISALAAVGMMTYGTAHFLFRKYPLHA